MVGLPCTNKRSYVTSIILWGVNDVQAHTAKLVLNRIMASRCWWRWGQRCAAVKRIRKGTLFTSKHQTCSCPLVQDVAHGQDSAPAHPGNSERPWQCVGTEPPTLGLAKEDLGLRLHTSVIVDPNVQSIIFKPFIAWLIGAFNARIVWLRHWCEYELLNDAEIGGKHTG